LGALSVAVVAILKAAKEGWALLKAAWRTIYRFNEVADDLLGDKAKGVLPMRERMLAMEKIQREQQDWQRRHAEQGHPDGGLNGPVPFQRGRRR
jgi:hypothetical protein